VKAFGHRLTPRRYLTLDRLAQRRSLFLAIVVAFLIFLMDTLSSLHFSVASLYVLVILLSARGLRRRGIISAGILCAALTLGELFAYAWFRAEGSGAVEVGG